MAIALVTFILTLVLALLVINLKTPGKRIEHEIKPLYAIGDEHFIRSMGSLLGPPILAGNRVESLENGDEIFPSMLEAIRTARRSVTFETFIYWSGKIGQEFSHALCERAHAGVRVHVLLDWIGSRNLDGESLDRMRKCGVQVERYRPPRWYNLSRLNNRTHRKILVVDGKIGFTGGVGIADPWRGHAQSPQHWRDTHFKLTGPAVAQLQSSFMDNWNATRPELLHGDDYFPRLDPVTEGGPAYAQVFKSSPEEGSGSVRLMYLLSIAHARESIRIASAYFVPDSHVRRALIAARQRGVSVEVLLPGTKIDTQVTRQISRSVWSDLLQAGVRIFEFQPTMYHCKFMIVDRLWVSVGSTNFDNRSFRLNDECNLNVLDSSFAAERLRAFENDRALSREITYADWQKRPLSSRLIEKVVSVIRSQV